MPATQPALVGVTFHHGSPPYEAGETAGFPADVAARYVGSGRAVYVDAPKAAGADLVDFDAMDRKALLAYARDHLGLIEAPPASVTDEEIREGLRAQAADGSAPAPVATPAASPRP